MRGGLKYIYLGWLKHGGTGTTLHVNYRHRSKFMHSNVRHKVHEYTAVTCQSSTCFHLKYSYGVCFLRLWIICKGTKPLCLGPLKHGETWRICHKNCIYLSTTIYMRTQVSYTICHCHISAHNAHQSNLRKNTVLKLPRNIHWCPLGLDTYNTDSAKKILNWVFFLKSQWCPFWVHMQEYFDRMWGVSFKIS